VSGTWLSGWITGDIVTAAEFKKGTGAIYDSTLAATAASITISSIPAGYAHLELEVYARGDTASTSTSVQLRFNSDTGSNYDRQAMNASGTSPAASETLAGTSAQIGNISAASAPADAFGAVTAKIFHYAGTADHKVGLSQSTMKTSTSSSGLQIAHFGFHWRSTSAITSITLLPGAGNFDVGSRFTLYVKGA
jgi:hypothetical protein